jgi:hypothetical protein
MSTKIIIAGSRDITDWEMVIKAVNLSGFFEDDDEEIEIVSGGAKGVDKIGEYISHCSGYGLKIFPADWDTHGKKAGILRNIQMGDYADKLVAIRKDNSRGTTHMIEYMRKLGKPSFVLDI